MLFKVNVSFKLQKKVLLPIIYNYLRNHADISSSCPQGKVYAEVTERPSCASWWLTWVSFSEVALHTVWTSRQSDHETPAVTPGRSLSPSPPACRREGRPQSERQTQWMSGRLIRVITTHPSWNYHQYMYNSSSPRLGFLRYVSLSLNDRKCLGG